MTKTLTVAGLRLILLMAVIVTAAPSPTLADQEMPERMTLRQVAAVVIATRMRLLAGAKVSDSKMTMFLQATTGFAAIMAIQSYNALDVECRRAIAMHESKADAMVAGLRVALKDQDGLLPINDDPRIWILLPASIALVAYFEHCR